MPQPELDQPAWMAALNRSVQRLGRGRALLLLCLLVWLMAVVISQLAISLLGQGNRTVGLVAATVCALGLTAPLGYVMLSLVQNLDEAHRRMTRHATLDMLTGTYNRRHFLDLVGREWARARRYDTDCAMLLLDVDHFKRVNDGFGHLCGDQLLRQIAEAAGETLRQADVLARFGGEEFIVFLPHTDPLGALDVAERIRERIEALNFSWNGHSVPISASIGVAALHKNHLTLDQLIHDADAALYSAKAAGRNCVRSGGGPLPGTPGLPSSLQRH